MPQLPLDYVEPFAALLGKMLYPGTDEQDCRKAETFVSQYLAEPLRQFRDQGGQIKIEDLYRLATGPTEILEDLQDRWWAGQATGEITKVLIALYQSDSKLASWKNAVGIVVKCTGSGRGTGRSTFMKYRTRFGSVAHLWAAWRLRGGRFAADALSGNSLAIDFRRFVCEAERIRLWGQGFRPERAKSEPLFDCEMWTAPEEWLAPLAYPQWPGEDWVPPIEATPEQLQGLRPAGRPRKQ